MTDYKIQKPFLKWVGGKTQIIDSIISKLPKETNNYHELFVGGGSVLFAILSLQKHNKILIKDKIYAYDINVNLINMYKNVQNNKDELYKILKSYYDKYDSITGTIINRKPKTIEEAQTSWRKVVASSALNGIWIPALSTALNYFDGFRNDRLPANLLQAQRDYFGAHTYERIDKKRGEFFHTNWTGRGGDTASTTYNA